MDTSYNRVAGQSKERLAAISDGIFGVAMTLLLLELHTPAAEAIHGERDLLRAVLAMGPAFAVYLMSFITLGIFWIGQQTQLNHLERADRNLTWLHLGFLFAVTISPFSTRLLSEFQDYRVALVVYWLNILMLGALLYLAWRYSERAGLIAPELPIAVRAAICRRIVIAQILYAIGAALCVAGTHWSIGFILLVQLNYVFAPGTWRRKVRPELNA